MHRLPTARIVVTPLPGRSGSPREWVLDDTYATYVMSMSWAPDGRRVSYIAGE